MDTGGRAMSVDHLLRDFFRGRMELDKNALIEALYGEYVGRMYQLSLDGIVNREMSSKLIEDHARSLALLIQNESQKIELENLNAKLKEAYALLEADSRSDYLTGINNRKTILGIFASEFSRLARDRQRRLGALTLSGAEGESTDPGEYRRGLACAILDVDLFKRVNDDYGHLAGDAVLKGIAGILSDKRILRSSDHVGRYGGEEFIVVMPETRAEDALKPIMKVCEAIKSRSFGFEGAAPFNVTVSGGIAEFEEDDERFEDILKRADEALYEAKRSGRDRVVAYRAEGSAAAEELVETGSASEMSSALERSMMSLQIIRRTVAERLEGISSEIREAAIIAARELCENAVKYGADLGPGRRFRFDLERDGGVLAMSVTSGIKYEADVEELVRIVDSIRAASDPLELYADAIRGLLERREARMGRLGLMRIAAECGFSLRCETTARTVRVLAEKHLSSVGLGGLYA